MNAKNKFSLSFAILSGIVGLSEYTESSWLWFLYMLFWLIIFIFDGNEKDRTP